MRRRWRRTVVIVAITLVSSLTSCAPPDGVGIGQVAARPGLAPDVARDDQQLVGVNYTHVDFDGCSFEGTPILKDYHEPGVRRVAQRQLKKMYADGLRSLRVLVWHMSYPGDHEWGVVASHGGRLDAQRTDNFVNLVSDIRSAGFVRLTIAFGPQWSNSPLRDQYRGSALEENYRFLVSVRQLALEYGPREMHFDLLNEGGPSSHFTPERFHRTANYVRGVWARYARDFGVSDATISVIGEEYPDEADDRLGNLIGILREASSQMPPWVDVHVNYDAEGVAHALAEVEETLASSRLNVPVVLGEAPYGDPAVGRVVSRFPTGEAVAVREVIQWYSRPPARCNVDPPYEGSAYLTAGG